MKNRAVSACNDFHCESDHAIHVNNGDVFLTLVRGGKRAFLHIENVSGKRIATVSGVATLRSLAEAIQRELPRARGRKR